MNNEQQPTTVKLDKDVVLGVCRLTYMLITELVKGRGKKEEYIEIVDGLLKEIRDNELPTTS